MRKLNHLPKVTEVVTRETYSLVVSMTSNSRIFINFSQAEGFVLMDSLHLCQDLTIDVLQYPFQISRI